MATLRPPDDDFANVNPYAPPEAALVDLEPIDVGGDLAEAESTRRTYLNHEASVKSLGSLSLLGGFFMVLATLAIVVTVVASPNREALPVLIPLALFYAALSGLHIAIGIGLHRLQPWARWTEVVLISISLPFLALGFVGIVFVSMSRGTGPLLPVGFGYGFAGLISVYFLYLLLSPKGAMVFSREYRAVIERTPHIKYRTSLLVKILLILFVSIIILAVVAALVGRRG